MEQAAQFSRSTRIIGNQLRRIKTGMRYIAAPTAGYRYFGQRLPAFFQHHNSCARMVLRRMNRREETRRPAARNDKSSFMDHRLFPPRKNVFRRV